MTTKEDVDTLLQRFKEAKPREKIDPTKQGMGFIIKYIYSNNNLVSNGELAKALHVSTARIAILTKKLMEKGILLKKDSDTDLRKTYFFLTENGIKFHKAMEAHFYSHMIYLIESLGKDKVEIFLEINTEMGEISKAYMGNHPFPKMEDYHA